MKTFKLFSTMAIIAFTAFQVNAQVGFNGTNNSGTYATALGSTTTASGYASTALGFRSTASGYQSLAAGHWSSATGSYAVALGARAFAQQSHAMAFGIDVRATANRSVSLGAGIGNGVNNAMVNNIPFSLMVGFKSTKPTLFVGPSNGGSTTGKVGIGTTNPDSELTVNGKIHCEEVLVDLAVMPDYVFEKYYTGASKLKEDYEMLTLEEVETFTKENHHLPEVPSAKEIEENGFQLKEMTALLLQKIEELTLYTVEQEKRIKTLEATISKQN